MPTTGPFAARLSEVAISNAASTDYTSATYVEVERMRNGNFSGTQDTAESSSNDDDGNKSYVATWKSAQLTFEMIADEAGTGQEHVWTSWANGEKRAFRLRPVGNVSGNKQIRMLGIVTNIEDTGDSGDVRRYRVTVQRSGGQTRENQ
jgi:hypothetical protein